MTPPPAGYGSQPQGDLSLTQSAWRRLLADKDAIGLPDLELIDESEFIARAAAGEPDRETRQTVVQQAKILFDLVYPHTAFKRERFRDVDPVAALTAQPPLEELEGAAFHDAMHRVFAKVCDPHSTYTPPGIYRSAVAFLPFRFGFYLDCGKRRYIVTDVMPNDADSDFKPGVELVDVPGGYTLDQLIDDAATLSPGSNPVSTRLRGISRMTIRPLAASDAPKCSWETATTAFHYVTAPGAEPKTFYTQWKVALSSHLNRVFPAGPMSVSGTWRGAYAATALFDRRARRKEPDSAPAATDARSAFPDAFEFRNVARRGANAEFGYVAIRQFLSDFAVDPSSQLPAEFARILGILNRRAPRGLIVDVRGNPGGDIAAAESMLELLTPRRIAPANFHLAYTRCVLDFLHAANADALGEPLRSIANDLRNNKRPAPGTAGAPLLTPGHPITVRINQTGQVYQGPVVLLIDAMTYSAADIFSGGFQDNGVGIAIGSDGQTGGGGASRETLGQIVADLQGTVADLKAPRQGDPSLTLAVYRSSRVGRLHGAPIEDIGVAGMIHPRTRRDLLENSADLIDFACEFLRGRKVHRAALDPAPTLERDGVRIEVQPTGVDRLRFFLDDNPVGEHSFHGDGAQVFTAPYPRGVSRSNPPFQLRVEAYSSDVANGREPVAVTRHALRSAAGERPRFHVPPAFRR